MSQKMKITMLGGTKSGKTCFMLGMYSVMRLGVRGFTFSTREEDPNKDWDLELSWQWDRIVEEEGSSRWPSTTDQPTTYPFDFRYGLARMISFDWLDYRGNALVSQPSDPSVQVLKEHLQSSSAIFLCVSGEYLTEGVSIEQLQAKALTGRMIKFLTELRDKVSEPPPIAIVITKYDLCRTRPKEDVIETIKTVFDPLFQDGTGWLVMICPVSLGNELAADPESGAISPRHVHLPVAYAIYSVFKRNSKDIVSQIDNKRRKISSLNTGFFSRWLNSDDIEQYTDQKAALLRQKEAIQKNIQLLASELVKGVSFYYEGKEVDAND